MSFNSPDKRRSNAPAVYITHVDNYDKVFTMLCYAMLYYTTTVGTGVSLAAATILYNRVLPNESFERVLKPKC